MDAKISKYTFLLNILLAWLIALPSPFAFAVHTECAENFTVVMNPSNIKGGHHVLFPTTDLKSLDTPDARFEQVIFNFVIKGKHDNIKHLKFGINGVTAIGRDGKSGHEVIEKFNKQLKEDLKLKHWWKKRHSHFSIKHEFSKKGDLLLVSLDLTELLINAQEQFTSWFQKLIHSHGNLMLSIDGNVKVVDAELAILGHMKTSCPNPDPDPDPAPDPTPVAPKTFINSKTPDSSPTGSTTMSFTFNSDQTNVLFNCSLDNAPAELCTSPIQYSSLGNGAHSFHVTSTNAQGLTDSTGASYSWEVDTIAPDVTIIDAVPSGPVTNSSNMSLAFSSNESASFQCALDNGAYTSCISPVFYSGLLQGSHSIDIIGTDSFGNTSVTPARYQWNVDLTAPTTTILQASPSGSVTSSSAMTLTFGANETSTFECSLDSGTFDICSSPLSYANLQEGGHNISVRATDIAGNTGLTSSYAWNIDQTAPVLTLGNVVPSPGNTNAQGISVQLMTNEPAALLCSLDGAQESACNSQYTANILTEGLHTFSATATDTAGNRSAQVNLSWFMDFSSPQISFGSMSPSSSTYINSTTLTVNVNATEPVTYSSSLDGVSLGQDSSPIVISGLAQGSHSLTLNAIDGAGNQANTITHNFNVDLTAPIVTIDSVAVSGTTSVNSNMISFSSNESATFECSFNGSGFSACTSPYSVAGLMQGVHTLWIRGIDIAGNTSGVAAFSWTVDQTPPKTTIVSVTPTGALINQSSLTATFTTNDATATSECSLNGGAFSSCSSPYSVQNLSEGAHNIQIRSSDSAGNMESAPATYGFTVDTTAPVVTINGNVGAITNSTTIGLAISANETATFSCMFDDMQVECAESYVNIADGAHFFSVTGTDLAGNMSLPVSFNWTVDTIAPTTTVEATQLPAGSANISFALSSSESNNTFLCSLDGSLFAACGSTQGYESLSSGSHIFIAKAVDRAGNIDSVGAQHSFTVQVALTTTITEVIPSETYTNSTSITFSFVANVSNTTFLCKLDSGAETPCASPTTYSGLDGGSASYSSHTFNVRAVDSGGNVDPVGATYTWEVDTLPANVGSVTTSITSTSFTISWKTFKPMTTGLIWAEGSGTQTVIPENTNYTIDHSVTVTGLKPYTVYSYYITGTDKLGQHFQSGRRLLRTLP